MPSDVSARAFEPFFTTKDIGHGTGLGLSQVYGFVKQSGGHARIYSELGQGTTIKMYFPRFGGDPLQDAPPEPVAVPPEVADTVLLVEDDEALRGYVSELLADLSYRVLVAPDAQKAMKILEGDDHVDLLLTDVVMPGTNGRELAKQATTLRPALPVLFMTGYSRNAIVHHGRLDEGVDLLQKPFTQSELANRVSEIIGRHKR
jgi:CheY-like chemotaxis protein